MDSWTERTTEADRVRVFHGDSRAVLKAFPDAHFDSVVCDPPYALVSIVKRFGGPNAAPAQVGASGAYARASAGFMNQTWDTGETAFAVEFWAEVYRVLKPGGHVIAFSGTRTYHRLACAVEDAGFEIRDMVAWLYGSGFPKSHDVSKGIDKAAGAEREVIGQAKRTGKEAGTYGAMAGDNILTAPATDAARQWQGWGTALKPALEPIVLARKPLESTVAGNVLRWGTGALNIDACRIGTDGQGGQSGGGKAGARGSGVDDLRGLQTADGQMEVAGSAGEAAHDLQSPLHGEGHGEGGKPSLGRGPLEGLEAGLQPPADGPSQRGRPGFDREPDSASGSGTSAGDGAASGATAEVGGDGPSCQRREDGQSDREPAPDGLVGTLAGASPNRTGTGRTASGERTAASRPSGRWPANVLTDGSEEVVGAFPETGAAKPARTGLRGGSSWHDRGSIGSPDQEGTWPEDGGGSAARFFYSAKADAEDRLGSRHPTVKPVDLMAYLVRLVTPPGGLTLDPFAGSGTTGVAAMREGMRCVLVEREDAYVEDIVRKLAWARGEGRLTALEQAKLETPEAKAKAAGADLPLFG